MAGATEPWSIWAMPPPGPLAQALAAEINDLAERYLDAPRFPPHVTLIGGFDATEAEARAALHALAAKLQVGSLLVSRLCVDVLASLLVGIGVHR